MRTPTLLRHKSVKKAIRKFVEQVSQIPQVEAVLLVQGNEGWEVKVIIDKPDLAVVDIIAQFEGTMIDQYGELPFLSDVVFRQGQPLDNFFSHHARTLFER